jgi:two-component system, response regulator
MDIPAVLIVEDEPNDIEFVTRALRKADLENPLVLATTVEHAQQLCLQSAPVLVILDLYLTGKSGLEFLEWLRAQPQPLRDVPVVIFSVSTDRTHQLRAKALRPSLFLGKPATEDVLMDAVQAFGLVRTVFAKGSSRRRWLDRREEPQRADPR